MSFTYDVEALDEALNRIRLEIGDTISTRILLQDEEIEQIISEQSVYNQRVANCCKLIAAKFARYPSMTKLEGFTETVKEVYDRYMEMAKKWGGNVSYPWCGGIEVDYKAANELDTSLVQPKFKIGMHNND